VTAALQALLAYLLGAIPTAYIAGRWLRGIDIRQHGSGNVGATNVFRVLGKGPGIVVLAIDIFKGWAAAYLLPRLHDSTGGAVWMSTGPEHQIWWPCVLGLLAVLGHSYTCFLAFKGGKGVATSAGVLLGLAPYGSLGAIGVFAVLFAITRMVSVGSLGAALALPGLVWYFKEWRPVGAKATLEDMMRFDADPLSKPVFWLAVALSIVVWIRHIPNIKRILNGTESSFRKNKKENA
jgi:glycerol-3-phosphate acyltransferase PlsY